MRVSKDLHFNQIDALRCLAMTAVIAQHCKLLPCGWIGVWLFYAISGFVVSTSLIRHAETELAPARQLREFYIRRAARIWPIYFGYVIAGFLISSLMDGTPQWEPLLSFLFFYNNFQIVFGPGFTHLNAGHLWTISVEMQFYVLFGFAFVFLPRRKLVTALSIMLVLCPALRAVVGYFAAKNGMTPGLSAFAVYTFGGLHFDSFAAGALLALRGNAFLTATMARRLLLIGMAALGLYAASYVLVNMMLRGAHGIDMLRDVISGVLFGQGREIFVYSAIALASAGLIATAITTRMPWTPLLEHPALQAIGKVSYGGYVYHQAAIALTAWALHLLTGASFIADDMGLGAKILKFGLAYGLTLGLAFLSYHYAERPIIAAANKRFLPARIRAQTATAGAGT